MNRIRLLVVALICIVVGFHALVFAQEKTEPPKKEEFERIAERQKDAKIDLDRLTDQIQRLITKLEEKQPEAAKNLEKTFAAIKQYLLAEDMQEIITCLKESKGFDAWKKEGKVKENLAKLLAILLSKKYEKPVNLHPDIKALEKAGREVEKILEKEKELKAKTGERESLGDELKNIERALRMLNKIIQKQTNLKQGKIPSPGSIIKSIIEKIAKLIEDQNAEMKNVEAEKMKPSPDYGSIEKSQGKMGKTAGDIAKGLQGLSESASQSMTKAQKAMSEAKMSLAQKDPASGKLSQSKAVKAMEDAKKELEKLAGDLAKKKPSEKASVAQKDLEKKTEGLSKNLGKMSKSAKSSGSPSQSGMKKASQGTGKASKSMGKASSQLSKGQKRGAQTSQKQALKNLEDAKKALEDAKQKVAERLKKMEEKRKRLAKLEKEEKKQAERSKELSKALQKGAQAQKSPQGKQAMSKASKGTKGASGNQQSAAGQMKKGSSSGAEDEQEEAIKKLKKARNNLRKAKRGLQELQQLQDLFEIEEALKEMVAEQKKINKTTVEVDKRTVRLGTLRRSDKIALKDIANREKELYKKAEWVTKKLDDGGAFVFAYVIKSTSDDMKVVTKELEEHRTGQFTQKVEDEILKKLEELLKAIKKEKQKRKKGGGKGGKGGKGKKPPLVPPLAELKMLKFMEVDVRDKTVDLNKKMEIAKERLGKPAEIQKRLIERLSAKQGGVKEAARKMAEELKRRAAEAEEEQ